MNNIIPTIEISESVPNQALDLYAPREKIYVRKIRGFFQRIRKYSLSVLMLMYFSFAWINIDGKQLVLFDLAERKFHLFGATFWPQDFTLLAFALIICAFGLFFVTSLFGRVWCGYSCPQTAWSFMFMWLEEFFEGSRNKRIELDKAEWDVFKVLKKASKHTSWVLLALATAVTFVGYFYPIRELFVDLSNLSVVSGWALFWIFFFTAATYINAGWLREQVCIYMCPYARFQSVMFNENTLIIGYDKTRGEPRGKASHKATSENEGACVDCSLCVQVCPVGIDIRDGLQYECIGCALCIDACDNVMTKLNQPTGLIRYASEKEFEQGRQPQAINKLSIAYGVVLLFAMGVFLMNLISRPMVELSAQRDRGALYYENGMGMIENSYRLKLVNKLERAVNYRVSVEGDFPAALSIDKIKIAPGELREIPVTVEARPQDIKDINSEITFRAKSITDYGLHTDADSRFIGPIQN